MGFRLRNFWSLQILSPVPELNFLFEEEDEWAPVSRCLAEVHDLTSILS